MSVKTPRREATVVLAMDVSNSMAATDIKPSRFEAAKAAARTFVNHQPSAVRIGVVAFGPGAVPVLQPTTEHANAIAAINRLTLGGGTSIGDGLVTSLGVIAGKPITIDPNALNNDDGKVDIGFFGSATIVVFSDGENLSQPDPVDVANVASVAGVRVQSIGVGTSAGTVVQIDGFSVATALDRDLLQKVASVTDGTYHEAGDAAGLSAISKSINLHFKVVSEHTEITGLFAAAAVALLLVGAALSILWFGRVV
jgi:Ca-activated chloride channel family protein